MKLKTYIFWAFLIVVGAGVFGLPLVAEAATSIAGVYTTNQHWTAAGSPYIVRWNGGNGASIANGATLTIDPGVVVKFESTAQFLTGGGKIVAIGTTDEPIIFTSLRDDSAGGDDNGDGAATAPAVGNWFRLSSSNDGDIFEHIEVRYSSLGLSIVFAASTVRNSYFHHNLTGIGVAHSSAAIVIEGNTMTNNSSGIRLDNGFTFTAVIGSNNNIYGNTQYGAYNAADWNPIPVGENWWGHPAGPCLPANHGDCSGYGDKISTGFILNGFLSHEAGVPPPPPPKTPVIIIPGITGTDLFHEGEFIWPDIFRMIGSPNDSFLSVLGLDENGNSLNNITTGDIVRKIDAGLLEYDIAEGLINSLQEKGYIENDDLFVFPYDWRKSIDEVATDLDSFIGSRFDPGQKVDIIAHSMGGLVMKQYILNFGAESIDKLIFVGTPHLGAPKSAKVLIFGDNMSIHILSSKMIKDIAANMPSLYQLLPNKAYFDSSGGYLKEGSGLLGYDATKDELRDQGLNSFLIQQAEDFYDSGINDLDLSSFAYNINGCDTATLGSYALGEKGPQMPAMTAGDGTVPLGSSVGVDVADANTYFVKKVSHSTMMTQESVRHLILAILEGASYSDGKITQDKNQCKLKGKFLGIFSPVDVKIVDQDGNYAGPNEFASFTNEIPGLTYEVLEEQKFVFLPTDDGQIYDVELDATGDGNFDMKIADVDGIIQDTIYYREVGITENSKAEFVISEASDNSFFDFDYLGDGNWVQVFPFSNLDQIQSLDGVPPEVELEFDTEALDMAINGVDDLSAVAIESGGNAAVLIDQSGNETEVILKQKHLLHTHQAEIFQISYNGAAREVQKNYIIYDWALDKNGGFNTVTQMLMLGSGDSIYLQYQGKSDQTVIQRKINDKQFKETKSGLVILKIKTNQGEIEYEY